MGAERTGYKRPVVDPVTMSNLREFGSAHEEMLGLYVFGSVAACALRPDSDVDIALIIADEKLPVDSSDAIIAPLSNLSQESRKAAIMPPRMVYRRRLVSI